MVGIPFSVLGDGGIENVSVLITNGNVLGNQVYVQQIEKITAFVKSGGKLVLIEPEFRVVGSAEYSIVDGIDLKITHRADLEKGGYDSYVFAEDSSDPLWKNIHKEHLKIFNGAYGGEIVSQYDVDFSVPSKRLASCGIDLKVVAASEVEYGKGKIILSRIQIRGRLVSSPSSYEALFARRPDPVAQQYLLNLIQL